MKCCEVVICPLCQENYNLTFVFFCGGPNASWPGPPARARITLDPRHEELCFPFFLNKYIFFISYCYFKKVAFSAENLKGFLCYVNTTESLSLLESMPAAEFKTSDSFFSLRSSNDER